VSLNPEQEEVVNHGDGPLRVGAVAGAGKTTALVERVAHLVEKRGISPDRILLISFSRIARDEMSKRISKRLPSHQVDGSVRTFHSLALEIYKREIGQGNIDTTGLLWTKASQEAFRRLGLEPRKKALARFSSRVKSEMVPVDDAMSRLGLEHPKVREIALRTSAEPDAESISADDLISVFLLTEKIRRDEGIFHMGGLQTFVGFDDMLYESAMLLRENSSVRERWSARWKHILQDEAQDENMTQAFIAEALADQHRCYVVVGDPAQSIYGFRGSNPRHILEFDKIWAGAKTVFMHRNYRSCLEVIQVANNIIGNMPANSVLCDEDDLPMEMTCERKVHGVVHAHAFMTSVEEADAIAETIQARYDSNSAQFRDQAVLVRMNFMTCSVEMALARASIPYRLVSGSSFFETKEARMIAGMLRAALGTSSDKDLAANFSVPTFRGGKALTEKVLACVQPDDDHLAAGTRALSNAQLTDWQHMCLGSWVRFIQTVRDRIGAKKSASVVVRSIVESTELLDTKKTEAEESEDQSPKKTVETFMGLADSFQTTQELVAMLDKIDKMHRGRKVNAVTVSTVHKAKGAEWGVVYLPQLVQGLFPSSRADLIEERRVFYVAATRARDELWMSYPLKREEDRPCEPSMFIAEADVPVTGYAQPAPVDKTPIGQQMGFKL